MADIKHLKKLYSQYKKIQEKHSHNEKNLKDLKSSFNKFIDEEQHEYNKGGKVKGYADGTDEPIQPENDDSPDTFEPTIVTGKARQPASEQELDQSLEDQAVEKPYENEDIAAELAATEPDSKEEVPEEKEESKEDEKKDEDSEKEKEVPELEDKSKDEEPDKDKSDDELLNAEEPSDNKSSGQRLLDLLKPQTNDLSAAQKERDQNILNQKIERASALAGSGISKTSPRDILANIDKQEAYLNLPVQKYQEQVQNQQNDPNSKMSQVVRDYLTTKGLKVPPGSSAADLLKVAPFLAKDSALQVQIQKALLSEKNKQADRDLRQQQINGYNERTKAQTGSANDRKMQSRFDLYAKALREGGDQSVKLARQNIVRAKNLFLTNGIDPSIKEKDINNLSNAKLNQVNKINVIENGIELNRLLSGSNQSAQSTLTKLIPNNMNMDATAIQDYITNKLNPAQQAEALKSYMRIAARARDLNHSVIENYHRQVLPAASQSFNYFPEQSKLLKDEFKNEGFNIEPTKPAAPSPEDSQALDHFNSMPDTDPNKAALGAILQKKGLM